MDALELLKSDHDKVNQIFQQFERGGNAQEFQQLFQQLHQELTIHTTIEEQIFYPAVRNADSNLVQEAYQEHAEAKQMLQEAARLDNTSAEWGDKMTKLMQAIQHHVQEEEGELFPKVRQAMGEDRLRELGQQLQQAKQTQMSQMGNMQGQMMNQPMMDMGGSQSQTLS